MEKLKGDMGKDAQNRGQDTSSDPVYIYITVLEGGRSQRNHNDHLEECQKNFKCFLF